MSNALLERGPRAIANRVSRRSLIRSSAAGVATTALVGGASVNAYSFLNESTPEPQIREYTLIASEIEHELMPGTTVRAWGYNGQFPGPEIRAREGDLIRVRLQNELPVGTTIHWHGVNLPPAMDGPAGLNQAAVEPGDEFIYEFIAKPAGTRWYHSHADPALQVPLGLYGPLVIEPRSGATTYDREYTVILGEWDMELTPEVATGAMPRGPRDQNLRGGELGSDAFLINGKMHGFDNPIRIAEGERILIRLVNAGHLAHPFHTHGHSFAVVATDGNPVPEAARWLKDTIMISPGERHDLELVGDNPGVWMVHCHIEHHMANGMMTLIAYDGYEPTGPAADLFDMGSGEMGMHDHGSSEPEPSSPTAEPTEAEVASPVAVGTVEIRMIDDRFDSADVTIPAGTTVTWVNNGANWHSVAAYDGSFESEKVPPGGTFSITFETPGSYQYICKHHGLQGMIAKITVTAT
jgi:FtsP/CotA-like multicopper oxidase with cupredoxin domain/plastocyanin